MFYALAFILLLCVTPLHAAETAVPDALSPWVSWVMAKHPDQACPYPSDPQQPRTCAWPGSLNMTLDQGGGQFSQTWALYATGHVPLPGSIQHWPQDVRVDGQPVVVLNDQQQPYIVLEKGSHHIEGRFAWAQLPNALNIPPRSGMIQLQLNHQSIPFPHREANGRLWLNEHAIQGQRTAEDRLQLSVFRRIIDDVPMRVVIHLDLQVTGQAREVVLGPVLPDSAIPFQMDGELPMRLEADGRLRLQVRPGHWPIDLVARLNHPVDALSLPDSNLPDSEVWAFDARPSLRQVEVSGVPSLDPRQTQAPPDWQHLPSYRVNKHDTMHLISKRRGDPSPSANTLSLQRHLWLDFEGKGYTFHDSIRGQMRQTWRLNMPEEMSLGRAVVNGEDQLITRLHQQDAQGVELRQGNIALQADGRYEGERSSIPVPGWDESFDQVNITLHLPPGWRLLAASGADSVGRASWLEQWTLLDIFLVLIASLAVYRLLGMTWGVVTLLCLALSWHESAAPQMIWLWLIAAIALLKVAPEGRLQRAAVLLRYGMLVILVIVAIPYMVNSIRTAIYPQLEQVASPGYAERMAEHAMDEPKEEIAVSSDVPMAASAPRPAMQKMMMARESSLSLYESPVIDPHAKVQTGPGLPEWQWTSITVSWNGPVAAGQRLHVIFSPPQVTATLKILSVLLVTLLGLRLAGASFTRQAVSRFLPGATVALLLAIMSGMPIGQAHAAEFPDRDMLNELEQRLIQPDACLPQCAHLAKLHMDVQGNRLRILLDVHSNAHVVIPVPGSYDGWMPEQVLLDGREHALAYDAQQGLVLEIDKGIHRIELAGSIKPVRTLPLALPMKPGQITVRSENWQVKGIYDDGRVEDVLHLERLDDNTQVMPLLQSNTLPPFVSLHRTLHFGLEWRVDTEVRRMTKDGQAIVLHIPLLPGEAVITEGIRVSDGYANVQLPMNSEMLHWQSILPPSDELTLVAADTGDWAEQWQLDISPIWHVSLSGIPPIHQQNHAGVWFPQWQPWPGEQLHIAIHKPLAVAGQTVTIDHSRLLVKPGHRVRDVTLEMRIRSSQADQHTITLPPHAVLGMVTIDGISQPIEQQGDTVSLPLHPGTQHISLNWQTEEPFSVVWQTPPVNIGQASVNADIEVTMPMSRWTLFVSGPQLGPAVLFWGVLAVVLLIALALGRSPRTPLSSWQWMLLGIGLSQTEIAVAMMIVAWLFALAWRREYAARWQGRAFNLMQIGLVMLTIATLIGLLSAVGTGLLGQPDMQIQGNGSTAWMLHWYADHSGASLPAATVLSVPMVVYRVLMLLWSLWLAFALLQWLKWAWQCFSAHGLWQKAGERQHEVPNTDEKTGEE